MIVTCSSGVCSIPLPCGPEAGKRREEGGYSNNRAEDTKETMCARLIHGDKSSHSAATAGLAGSHLDLRTSCRAYVKVRVSFRDGRAMQSLKRGISGSTGGLGTMTSKKRGHDCFQLCEVWKWAGDRGRSRSALNGQE